MLTLIFLNSKIHPLVDGLFKTLCDCALLNPDPEGGKFFDDVWISSIFAAVFVMLETGAFQS